MQIGLFIICCRYSIILFPVAPELYRGHGSAVSLPGLIVGTRHCRVLAVSNINADATGFDITYFHKSSCDLTTLQFQLRVLSSPTLFWVI
ncbi:hypothetical protein [Microcoleus sp. K4-B3]|uniref:hypothetical protein n=1 Tax=Microcoleus sp. K4-B3 TaxID=2818791 RepID=UPI002FD3C34B